MSTKRCPNCEEVKDVETFAKDRTRKDGLNVYCRACDKTRHDALAAAGFCQNHSTVPVVPGKTRCQKCVARDAARGADVRARESKCCTRGCNEIAPVGHNRCRTHSRAQARNFARRHPEIRRADNHNRRARQRKAKGKWAPADERKMFNAQEGRCAMFSFCGNRLIETCIDEGREFLHRNYHADHKMPLSRNGSNHPRNHLLLCASCNTAKHDKTMREFRAYIRCRYPMPGTLMTV